MSHISGARFRDGSRKTRTATLAMASLLGAALLAATEAAVAQGSIVLRGVVTSAATAAAIAGARIVDADGTVRATTDSTGTFRISLVPGVVVVLVVQAVGFEPLQRRLEPLAGDTATPSFALTALAQELPRADVVGTRAVPPRLSEFEERRQFGQGRFLTDSVLRKNDNRQLSEVMSLLPSLQVVRGLGNAAWIGGSRGSGSSRNGYSPDGFDAPRGAKKACYATVMLDGNYVFSSHPGELLFDVNSLATSQVAGIEFYAGASTVPMKFRGVDTGCGLLIIWTK